MSNVKENLLDGKKSSMHISTEADRKLIQSMVRGNIIDKPVSFEELLTAINNSNGRVLRYQKHANTVIYFDSTGRYISDYKGVSSRPYIGKPRLESSQATKKPKLNLRQAKVATTSERKAKIEQAISKTKQSVKMYRGVIQPTEKKLTQVKQSVKMYRGVPV